MQGASGQCRDSFLPPQHIIQWQQGLEGLASKLDDHGSSAGVSTLLRRRRGPIGASWVACTTWPLSWGSAHIARQGTGYFLSTLGVPLEHAALVRALP